MYCTKCGNILKQEDNFCNICGTPNNAKEQMANQGISGYGAVRDDEPVNLDDFFKFDDKAEKTLEKMDREIEEIKMRAKENLLRRKTGDASARRAARLAKRAADFRGEDKRDKEFRQYGSNYFESSDNMEFNDQIFQKTFERENYPPLAGRRGQAADKIREKPAMTRRKEPSPAYEEELFHTRQERPVSREFAPGPRDLPKQKKHHLFREDTMELPNIFDEIAESMEKSRQNESNAGEGVLPIPPKDNFDEGTFPIPPKDDFDEGTFPIPPKDDFDEGTFPISSISGSGERLLDTAAKTKEEVQIETQAEEKIQEQEISDDSEPRLFAEIPPDVTYTASSSEPEYEYFRYSRPKKKSSPKGFAVVVVILIVIFTALGVKMFYDGDTPASVFNQIKEVFNFSGNKSDADASNRAAQGEDSSSDSQSPGTGQGDGGTPNISELKNQGASDPAKMLQYLISQGINKNIAEIEYNPLLKYEIGKKYKTDDIDNSTPITDNLFYEENGQKYYYTEKIMSTMIQYNSMWIDYFNTGNKAVLDLIQTGSPVYQRTVNFSSDGAKESFVKFEMGEIRKGKNGYYIWTRETLSVTTGGKTDTEEGSWIYYLEPSGKTMKIVNNYYL